MEDLIELVFLSLFAFAIGAFITSAAIGLVVECFRLGLY